MLVCDFVDGKGQWVWDRFQDTLPLEILVHIAATKTPSAYDGDDKMYWNLSTFGNFTITSAYNLVAGRDWPNVSAKWKVV